MNANRHKRILSAGLLGNLISGMFFGTGCLIVEHIDNTWISKEDSTTQETPSKQKVTERNSTPPNDNKPANGKHLARTQSPADKTE
jgi:hypothetical protein